MSQRVIGVKRLNLILSLVFLACYSAFSQESNLSGNAEETTLRKQIVLSELKSLALELPKIDGLFQRAFAGAEIADAAWELDRAWAQELLRGAYKLTYPAKEELDKISSSTVVNTPQQPNSVEGERSDVRNRIFSIARRDKAFANQLINEASKHAGSREQQSAYSTLAGYALEDGDNQTAIPLIERAIESDPTQLAFVSLVNDLAKKDRESADKLILKCIASLRPVPLSNQNRSAGRAYFTLTWLVFPNSIFPDPNARVPDPGPSVMKAYVSYVIESLAGLEQREPNGIRFNRSVLLSTWLPLQAYAPELTAQFLQLEGLSRASGQEVSLPTQSYDEADKERFRKMDQRALNSNEPDDRSVNSAINRAEFELARVLIDKIAEGRRKEQFFELLNTKEAISLANKGDLLKARSLAEKLTTAASIVQVYPVIISGYGRNKDQIGALASVQRAIKQLHTADTRPFSTLPGMPVSMISTASPVLSGLLKLGIAILPIDGLLALEMLDEVITVANKGDSDTRIPVLNLMAQFVRKLAERDETRAFVAAQKLKDPLCRTVALATVYQWKAKELEKLSQPHALGRSKPHQH